SPASKVIVSIGWLLLLLLGVGAPNFDVVGCHIQINSRTIVHNGRLTRYNSAELTQLSKLKVNLTSDILHSHDSKGAFLTGVNMAILIDWPNVLTWQHLWAPVKMAAEWEDIIHSDGLSMLLVFTKRQVSFFFPAS
ncbi:hypothetical protein X801_10817, partial [Opisthorchis viverrini]